MRVPLSLIATIAVLAGCQRQPDPAPAPSPSIASPTPSAPPEAPADLSRFAGEYPTEGKDGAPSFLRQPLVRAAVAGVVPDADVRALVLGSDVTATPVAMVDGKLVAFGCEPHNCGPHNWAIAIRPDGTDAAVCLYDQDRRIARWYPEDAGPAPTNGCPSGE